MTIKPDSTPQTTPRRERKQHAPRRFSLTMRELGKLTVEEVTNFDHPVPVTSHGKPVAWLVPLTPAETRRAEMIASGRLEPRRREDLEAWKPEPPVTEGESTLSELLLAQRNRERS